MSRDFLRVGVALDSMISVAWIANILTRIQVSDFARLELVFVTPCASQPGGLSLFQHYERWDYQRNKASQDALAPVQLSPILNGISRLTLDPNSRGPSEDQMKTLKECHLDVILRFDGVSAQNLSVAARFGVWFFQFDEGNGIHDPAPLFWPVFDRDPVVHCSLRVSSSAGRKMAYQGSSATDPASLYRTRNPVFWKLAAATIRALRELYETGPDYLHELPLSLPASSPTRKLSDLDMVYFLGSEVSRWLRAKSASLLSREPPKWCIGIRRRIAERSFDDPSGYSIMPSAKDRFYADPFLLERDGFTYLLFEDFRYDEGRAVISCCELDRDGKPGVPFEVLRRPYHLSYPFLFEDRGEIYMIPETKSSRAVELYRATSFPTEWVKEENLLSDIAAVDTTIHRMDDTLWMFTGVSDGAYSNSDELSLYYAKSLRGPWTPHPQNPPVSNVQQARSAGMIFHDAGRLIRTSQDCGKAYGYALVFSEILTLTETHYEERVIHRITPDQIAHAISNHTYNQTELFEVTDRTLPASIAAKRGA